jgi:hypothetical protein
MVRFARLIIPATAAVAVPLLLAAPSLGASPRYTGEVHADLVTENGTRVASLSGNVGPKGFGSGDIVPLNGAKGIGMRRPERVFLWARRDNTVVVLGQQNTKLTLSDRGQGQMVDGFGALGRGKGKGIVAVNVRGAWDQRPFHPRSGQKIVVLGSVKGAIATALGKRYTLVKYSSAKYSRDRLIENPSRYRGIAGVIVGGGISAGKLAKLDIARSMHNDGRFVATTLRNGMLDRHMYVVSHAHTGQGGVILRREAPRLGYQVHSYPQIREPILTSTRVGAAKSMSEAATFTPAMRRQAADGAVRSLVAAIRKAEALAPLPKPKKGKKGKRKSETQTTATTPATVTAGSDDAAFYTVPVNQYISANITAASVYNDPFGQTYNWTSGYQQLNGSAPETEGFPGGKSGVATQMVPVATGAYVAYDPFDVLSLQPPAMPTGYAPNACQVGYSQIYPSGTPVNSQGLPDFDKSVPTQWAAQWQCAPTPNPGIWGACTVAYPILEKTSAGIPPYAMYGGISSNLYSGAVKDVLTSNESQTTGTYVPAEVLWNCPNLQKPAVQSSTVTQAVGVTYNSIYTVSLAQSTTEVTTQAITETNSAQFNALATPTTPMGRGSYSTGTGVASAGTSFTGASETGLGLALAYHSVSLDCSACKGTSGGTVTPAFSSSFSSPTQQVTQVQASSSTGTSTSVDAGANWSTSTSNESGWSVSGNIGAFGGQGTGGVSGGYSQSTTTTNTQGGSIGVSEGTSLNSSSSFTTSNWVTTPDQGQDQAAYTTYSTTVTGAGGSAANAAYSLPFPSSLMGTGVNTGFISTPSQYGGNGPGPTCASVTACGPAVLSPQPTGSNENLTGFTQGSTSFFQLDTASNQLGVGSASPWVNDTFYLLDQGVPGAGKNLFTPVGSPTIGTYIEMQILGQSQLSVSQPALDNQGAWANGSTTGSSGASGITTYYNAQGQVVNSASQATYQTTGLDLCAPPVLTPALWDAGCDDDPNFSGPPAVYQAAPPAITTASTTNPIQHNGSTGQAEVASPAPALTCNPGNWTGSPTFAYQWQQWNSSFGDWQNIAGATGSTYTPPSALSTSTYFTCNVTATNSMGSISEPASSVEVIVGG